MMPEEYEPSSERMSYILTLGWGLFFTIILQIIFFILFYLSNYKIGYTINIICLVFSFVSIYLLKYTKKIWLASNIIAAIVFINTTINSYFTGGLHSSILLWLLIIPIISIFILERKHGIFWVIASLVVSFIFFAYFPDGSPDSIVLIGNEHFDIWVNLFLLIALIWFSALVIDNTKNKAIKDSEKAREETYQNSIALEAELAQRHIAEYALRQSEEKLKHLANTDVLTELINRRRFFELAEKELERSVRYQIPLSISIFDIDDFKSINDQYGHLVGDQVLYQMSKRFSELARKTDILARYGGDEFVILFPHTEGQTAFASSDRIRVGVKETPFLIENHEIWVTLSMGVASFSHEETADLDFLLDCADKALYKAKNAGKNKTSLWEG